MNVVRGGYNGANRRGRGNYNNYRHLAGNQFRGGLKISTQKTPRYPINDITKSNEMRPPLSSRNKSATTSRYDNNMTMTNRGNITISSNHSFVTPRCRILAQSSTGRRHTRTSGSTPSNITTNSSCYILAISEGRGNARGEVGIAAIDLRRLSLSLSQFSDSHSYIHSLTKIHFYNPVEIIVPHTFSSGVIPTELYKLIKDHFPKITITSIPRRQFSDTEAFQQIQQLCAVEYESVKMLLMHKFYALTSAAAVLKYVQHIQCIVFAPKLLKIEYHASEYFTLIDVETAIRLELVESLSENVGRGSSLLSVLNYTITLGGLRNLRANILQPLYDLKMIDIRLKCIEELKETSNEIMIALESIIKELYDIEKILWLCVLSPSEDGSRAGEAQLNHMLLLKTSMDMVPNIVEILKPAKSEMLCNIRKELENPKYEEILNKIKTVLQENVHAARGAAAHMQRCFAVKPGISGLLDVARTTYSELINQIEDKVADLSETHNLPLRLHNNATKGFHVIMPIPRGRSSFNTKDLPRVFFDVQHHGSCVSMTTEDIVLLNQQAKESLNEIHSMSNMIIFGLLTDLRPYIGCLYKLCEHIAELDLVISLTKASLAENYTKPNFSNHLELIDSVHPMLDFLLPVSPVPNNVFASSEFNYNIITGPNMGGKSIYIKQIALLQIMAQIGCFVPAKKATFRIADHIFSRISFNDSIELNASTFVLEMKEIDFILKNMTPKSLIIIDELCRSTSSEEGTSLAWAVSEKLLNTEAFTFFTTHFLPLTKLQEVYLNVTNLHTETEDVNLSFTNQRKLIYKHKILPGVTPIEFYGLVLAKNTNLPTKVVELAEELAVVIAKYKKPVDLKNTTLSWNNVVHKLVSDFKRKLNVEDSKDEIFEDMVNKFKEKNSDLFTKFIKSDCIPASESSLEEVQKNVDENDSISNDCEVSYHVTEILSDNDSILEEYKDDEDVVEPCEEEPRNTQSSTKSLIQNENSLKSVLSDDIDLNLSPASVQEFIKTPPPIKTENQSDSCWILEPAMSMREENGPIRMFDFTSIFNNSPRPSTSSSVQSTPRSKKSVYSNYKNLLQNLIHMEFDT